MFSNLEGLKEFLTGLKEENIFFSRHFFDKNADRPYLSEKLVIDNIKNTSILVGFQKQIINQEEICRIGLKLSSRYTLVIVFKIKNNKDLYIITAWKTDKKWQKSIQK
ncbi:hypothetical protein HYW76_05035 [Candidatus Pacearchaeota archaeon]|nr:hypothetical protein [Candidatus Pacearchaeota archaeon]